MYDTIKGLIARKRFKSLEDLKRKLVVYNAADLITDDEMEKLLDYGREVYGENMDGTKDSPIPFNDGMTVMQNYYYTKDGVEKLWFGKQNAQPTWDNENWVDNF